MSPYTEKDFYRLAEILSAKFYNKYRNLFTKLLMDISDVKQESYLIVLNLLRNKDLKVTLPLVKKAVSWRVTQLLGNYLHSTEAKVPIFIPLSGSDEQNPDEYLLSITTPAKQSPLTSPHQLLCSTLYYQIKEILSPEQEKVFLMKNLECLTFKQIGSELGFSRQRAEQVYRKSVRQLRLRLRKNIEINT